MAEGHFARHLRRMRTLYKKQQDELVTLLKKHLGDYLEVDACDTGMHLIAWMLQSGNARELAKKAANEGVLLQAVSDYAVRFAHDKGLIMGFTGFGAKDMEQAVMKLKKLLVVS